MHRFIDGAEQLALLVNELASAKTIALDSEFMRVDTYWPRLALIQARGDGGDIALIDPLPKPLAPALSELGALLAAPARRVAMHSASEDLIALAALLPGAIVGLYDTQIAAAFSGFGAGIGYQRLVADVLGIHVEKGEQRSDWLKRPLSDAQRRYAALDVAHIDGLIETLDRRLDERGYARWCREECRTMAEAAHAPPLPANPHHEFKSLWRWPPDQQQRLEALLIWREHAARKVDVPKQWLIDNPTAVELIETPPRDIDEVAARMRKSRRFLPALRESLLDALSTPIDAAAAAFEPIPAPLDEVAEARFDVLRAALAARAEALDLPAPLIAPRRVLEQLARQRSINAITGWRAEVLAPLIAAIG